MLRLHLQVYGISRRNNISSGFCMRILAGCCLFFFTAAGQSIGDSQVNAGKNSSLTAVAPRSADIQLELETLSGTAERIYELADENKWRKVGKKFDDLKKSENAINAMRGEGNDFFLQHLREKMEDLEHAITVKNRKDTRKYANNITYLEAAMIGELRHRVPTNALLLGYCGREMEILAEENDLDKLSSLVVRMHLIWQSLIPQLVDRNATREIKSFSEIMKRLGKAKTPDEFNQLASRVLDEVSGIEQVFRKSPK